MKTLSLTFLALLALAHLGRSQGSFENLDFESAVLVPIPGDSFNRVYFNQAFPNWAGSVGTSSETASLSNSIFLCCSGITVVDHLNQPQHIEGTFSALLHASFDPYGDPNNPRPANTALAQTGLVPIGMQSLLFKAQAYGSFAVELGGQPLSLLSLSTGSNYTLYGADIVAWAGQEAELRFTAFAGDEPARGGSIVILDSISFSPTPIPEPSTWALLACGGAALAAYRWRHKRQ